MFTKNSYMLLITCRQHWSSRSLRQSVKGSLRCRMLPGITSALCSQSGVNYRSLLLCVSAYWLLKFICVYIYTLYLLLFY